MPVLLDGHPFFCGVGREKELFGSRLHSKKIFGKMKFNIYLKAVNRQSTSYGLSERIFGAAH